MSDVVDAEEDAQEEDAVEVQDDMAAEMDAAQKAPPKNGLVCMQ